MIIKGRDKRYKNQNEKKDKKKDKKKEKKNYRKTKNRTKRRIDLMFSIDLKSGFQSSNDQFLEFFPQEDSYLEALENKPKCESIMIFIDHLFDVFDVFYGKFDQKCSLNE